MALIMIGDYSLLKKRIMGVTNSVLLDVRALARASLVGQIVPVPA